MTSSALPGTRWYLVTMAELRVERLGFVGFGEAAYHLRPSPSRMSRPLKWTSPSSAPHAIASPWAIRSRRARRETKTQLVEFSAALAAPADVIISAVTADQAADASRDKPWPPISTRATSTPI